MLISTRFIALGGPLKKGTKWAFFFVCVEKVAHLGGGHFFFWCVYGPPFGGPSKKMGGGHYFAAKFQSSLS